MPQHLNSIAALSSKLLVVAALAGAGGCASLVNHATGAIEGAAGLAGDAVGSVRKTFDRGAPAGTPSSSDYWAALRGGDLPMVRFLISRGEKVNATDAASSRPLHIAAFGGHLELARFLISAGAVLDARNIRGETPLSLAAGNGHADIVALLLEAGANVNRGNPLYEAVRHDRVSLVETLISHGADINRAATSGLRPLHAAVARRNTTTIGLLLAAGADPESPGTARDLVVTPVDIARGLSSPAILEQLQHRRTRPPTRPSPPAQEPATTTNTPAAGPVAPPPEKVADERQLEPAPRLTESPSAPLAFTQVPEPRPTERRPRRLAYLATDELRKYSLNAIRRKFPEIKTDELVPGYVVYMVHPTIEREAPVIVEWMGNRILDVEEGETPDQDRVKLRKLKVRLTLRGRPVEVIDTTTWLYR